MLLRHCMLFVLLACVSIASRAETCKYADSEGHVIYSNTPNNPPKGAKKLRCFDDPKPNASPPPAATAPKSSDAPKSGDAPKSTDAAKDGFPRVDGNTQKKRDDERRRILEQELTDEQQQLADAKQKLAEQEAVRTGNERNYQRFLERVQPFRDTVATHERNVEAIKREISNLK
jgi:hypothetical protein